MGADQSSGKGDGWDGWPASWTPCVDMEDSSEKLQAQRTASLALANPAAEVSATRNGGKVFRSGSTPKFATYQRNSMTYQIEIFWSSS